MLRWFTVLMNSSIQFEMYQIGYSGSFKKDIKTLKKRSLQNFESLRSFIKELQITGYKGLDRQYKPISCQGSIRGIVNVMF